VREWLRTEEAAQLLREWGIPCEERDGWLYLDGPDGMRLFVTTDLDSLSFEVVEPRG
jgi:hypothetical protein